MWHNFRNFQFKKKLFDICFISKYYFIIIKFFSVILVFANSLISFLTFLFHIYFVFLQKSWIKFVITTTVNKQVKHWYFMNLHIYVRTLYFFFIFVFFKFLNKKVLFSFKKLYITCSSDIKKEKSIWNYHPFMLQKCIIVTFFFFLLLTTKTKKRLVLLRKYKNFTRSFIIINTILNFGLSYIYKLEYSFNGLLRKDPRIKQ